jgi:hypothetical protein
MFGWMVDAFFWLVLPVAVFEALRLIRLERKRLRRSIWGAIGYGGFDLIVLALCAATSSPLLLSLLAAVRIVVVHMRERELWIAGLVKTGLMIAALGLLMATAGIGSFTELPETTLAPIWRNTILVLISLACAVAILPVQIANETKESLAAPIALVVFVRVALPLGASEPRFALVVPVVSAILALICALWLLSAGSRANHFEPSTLVSELVECERGVVLSFVWLGLSSGEHLAQVGALLEWWAGALALLALEAALRRRPLPKPMVFFALAMSVCLPGTIGFVAEDLLAHGLLELRPLLAAAFVGVAALNAAALYLALVNIIVDLRAANPQAAEGEARPSFMLLGAAALSVLMGVVPKPFVAEAEAAHEVIVTSLGGRGVESHGVLIESLPE